LSELAIPNCKNEEVSFPFTGTSEQTDKKYGDSDNGRGVEEGNYQK
jgi:hypothetical protein